MKNLLLKRALVVLTLLVAIAIPVVAFAIPGSGDFTSLESPSGRAIADLYNILAMICLVVLVLVESVLLLTILKFRRKSDDERPAQVHGYLPIEIAWTVAAAVVQIYIGIITLEVMDFTEVMPETDMTVEAIAYQWGWQFRYPDYDNMLTDDLVVPAHKNIKLEVTSKDVIHSIFIPDLGVKIDAVPGRYNYWWFNADGPVNQVTYTGQKQLKSPSEMRRTTRPQIASDFYNWLEENPIEEISGLEKKVTYLAQSRKVDDAFEKYSAIEYSGMCTELCGKGHFNMYFRTVAMTESSFEQWVQDRKSNSAEADGAALYEAKCATCHQVNGAGTVGTYPPITASPWATDPERKPDHIEVVLLGSNAESLKSTPTKIMGVDYGGVMQAWNESFNDEEVAAIVNHERTSWGNEGGEVTAEDVAAKREMLSLPPFPAGGAKPTPEGELLTLGEKTFAACSSCHGNNGVAVVKGTPNLASNPTVLADPKSTISIITKGHDTKPVTGSCPPMGATMNAMQIASLLTYIRKSFGNEASAVQPEEARRLRNELKQ